MEDCEMECYLDPTKEAGKAFLARDIPAGFVMLNLLRFREWADYSSTPNLAPSEPIRGKDAYKLYLRHTIPFLKGVGGELVFVGQGGQFLIGPLEQRWDLVLMIRQRSVKDFVAMASNPAYTAGLGHRVAALSDSRLLPIVRDDE